MGMGGWTTPSSLAAGDSGADAWPTAGTGTSAGGVSGAGGETTTPGGAGGESGPGGGVTPAGVERGGSARRRRKRAVAELDAAKQATMDAMVSVLEMSIVIIAVSHCLSTLG